MPTYSYKLADGRTLSFDLDREPTAQEVFKVAQDAGLNDPSKQFAPEVWKKLTSQSNANLAAQAGKVSETEKAGQRNIVSRTLDEMDKSPLLLGGPEQIKQGARRIGAGEYTGGASDIIRGTGKSLALPLGAPLAIAAPLPMALGVATGAIGQQVGERGAAALGASPDQAALVGDITGIASGGLGPKAAPAVRSVVSSALQNSAKFLPGAVETAATGIGAAKGGPVGAMIGRVLGKNAAALLPKPKPVALPVGPTAQTQLLEGFPAPSGGSIPLKPVTPGVGRTGGAPSLAREPYTPDLTPDPVAGPGPSAYDQLGAGLTPPPGGGRPIGVLPPGGQPARPFPAGERFTFPEGPAAPAPKAPTDVPVERPGDAVARMMGRGPAEPQAPLAAAPEPAPGVSITDPNYVPGSVPEKPMPYAEPGRYFEHAGEMNPQGPTVPAIPPGGHQFMDAQFARNNPILQQQELTGAFSGDRSVNWARNIADRLDLEGVAPGDRTPSAVAARDIPGQTPAPFRGSAQPPMSSFNPMGAEILARQRAAQAAAAAGPEVPPPPSGPEAPPASPPPPAPEPAPPAPEPDAPVSSALTAEEVPTDLPPELQMVLRFDPTAREAWTSLQGLSKAKLSSIVKQKMPGLSDLAAYVLKGRP